MSRLCLIALMLFLLSTVEAQQFKVDTLYSGLKNPTSLLIANDAIYVVEQGNHRVLKLDLNGNLIEKYGNRGSGNYQFDSPTDIASSTGLKIFISDPGNNRIQVFDKRWQYLSSIKANNQFESGSEITPSHLGVNKFGEVIFYNETTKVLGKYNEDGAYLDQIPIPSDIKDVSGLQVSDSKIFILDKKSELIHRLSENGFYESFYEAKRTGSFFYRKNEIFGVKNDAIEKQGALTKKLIFSLEKKSEVNDLYVDESKFYILTSYVLIRILEE